jgi:hypothetical protein
MFRWPFRTRVGVNEVVSLGDVAWWMNIIFGCLTCGHVGFLRRASAHPVLACWRWGKDKQRAIGRWTEKFTFMHLMDNIVLQLLSFMFGFLRTLLQQSVQIIHQSFLSRHLLQQGHEMIQQGIRKPLSECSTQSHLVLSN